MEGAASEKGLFLAAFCIPGFLRTGIVIAIKTRMGTQGLLENQKTA